MTLNRIFLTSFIVVAIMAMAADTARAAVATVYQVSVEKIELCTSSACASPTILGSGAASFDIASASVGASLGSYASTDGLPIGATYTHIRATISRTFEIKGTVAGGSVTGGTPGGDCSTITTPSVSAASYTAGGITAHSGAESTQTLVVANSGAYGGGQPDYSAYPALGIVDNVATMTFTTALSSSYTVGDQPPTITISFSTANSLGAYNAGGNCALHPLPPVATITIK